MSDIAIREVALRDGLQDLGYLVPTADKLTMLQLLHDAGMQRIEATSMVPSRLLPQFGDADEVLRASGALSGLHTAVFAPNARGVERALAIGVDEVALAIGTTDALNEANFSAPTDEVLRRLEKSVAVAQQGGCEVTLTLGGAFGCPFTGEVAAATVEVLVGRLSQLRPDAVVLGDTIGTADVQAVGAAVAAATASAGNVPIGIHLHGGRRAVNSVVAGAGEGAQLVDTSMNGLGGCPFVPHAPGNTPTVSVVARLEADGFSTGLDLERLQHADAAIARVLAGSRRQTEAPHA